MKKAFLLLCAVLRVLGSVLPLAGYRRHLRFSAGGQRYTAPNAMPSRGGTAMKKAFLLLCAVLRVLGSVLPLAGYRLAETVWGRRAAAPPSPPPESAAEPAAPEPVPDSAPVLGSVLPLAGYRLAETVWGRRAAAPPSPPPESAAEPAAPEPVPDSAPAPSTSDAETFLLTNAATGEVFSLSRRDYLIGAVAAEMPVSWPDEALKAQAIPARCFPFHGGTTLLALWPLKCR